MIDKDTKKRGRSISLETARALTVVIAILGTVCLLVFAAWMLARNSDTVAWKLLAFTVACLVVFHTLLRLLGPLMSERSLRSIDYYYLGLALLGISGIIAVQGSFTRGQLGEMRAAFLEQLEKIGHASRRATCAGGKKSYLQSSAIKGPTALTRTTALGALYRATRRSPKKSGPNG